MKIFTMGYSGKTAQEFFELLKQNGINQLVDIRIYPNSDDAMFASKRDLPYLLREIVNCGYSHNTNLAPTAELLDKIHRDNDWEYYLREFTRLMDERGIPNSLDRDFFEKNRCCLLCFEATPERCHRRLVAERMQSVWRDLEIVHL